MCGVLAGDVQTTTGSNVRLLQMETGLDPFTATSEAIKKILVSRLPGVPDRDKWRLGYLTNLLQARGEAFYAGEETELISTLIDSLCSS